MQEQQTQDNRPVNPRRRKRTRLEIFKEAYLPMVIACCALLLILIIIIGSVVRGFQYRNLEAQMRYDASVAAKQELDQMTAQAESLLFEAASHARHYDYDSAIEALDRFSGDETQFPEVSAKRAEYAAEKEALVEWTDITAIPNLSFQLLIADAARAFNDANYASAYKRNFITTEEFSRVLEQLYKNNYILISTSDIITTQTNDSGMTYFVQKPLYLPAGKKPVILTQTNVNYSLYMVDSDEDMLPDSNGAGFANKILIDENGNLACELVTADGTVETGAYDLIPILESFIATHPDFSYKGARAVIALTGYNGLFGYRTHAEAQERFTEMDYSQQIEAARLVARTLRERGYELACYTYENRDYSNLSANQIEADLSGWTAEVLPILGQVDIFVFAREGDLAGKNELYTNDSYRALANAGFTYYMGYCDDGDPWMSITDHYVRQGRLIVSAVNMTHYPQWYDGILDPGAVLVETR